MADMVSIRFGYKLWVAADPSGYIHHAEPYCGSSTRLPATGLGQGGDVVLGLVDHIALKPGTRIYFDNLFIRWLVAKAKSQTNWRYKNVAWKSV
jgi:hypothetical protein